jgi:hypothetical protein
MPRFITKLFSRLLVVLVVANGFLAFHFLHREAEERRARGDPDAPGAAKLPAGTPGFPLQPDEKFNLKLAQSYGVEFDRAREDKWHERVTVYGRVVPNPRATYEVRSPFAGTLLAGDKPWPHVGGEVKPGQVLGSIAVRVTPQERLELHNKLEEARLKEKGARDIHDLRTAAVTRLEKAASGVIAQRDLDDAKVQLSEAKTQLATAEAAVQIWQKTLEDIDQMQDKASDVWRRPLGVPVEPGLGTLEVTELAAQPGTAVEAGGLVVRLIDPTRALVRLDFPAEFAAKGAPTKLKLTAIPGPTELKLTAVPGAGTGPETMSAALVGPAPTVDGSSQLTGFYYLVHNCSWRAGRFVQAELLSPNATPREAVSVPASAVLYHQGRVLVYVLIEDEKTKDKKYQRREVQVLGFEGGRCFVVPRRTSFLNQSLPNGDVGPDVEVAVSNPQVLLSIEFRREVDND